MLTSNPNPRKYHFIYKTTCKVNGKFYYGMHSTDSLDDGYIGSGTYLWHAIKKYGRENFSIEILEFLPDRESLKKREAELITEDLLKDSMCMNLTLGGHGSWHAANRNPDCKRVGGRIAGAKTWKQNFPKAHAALNLEVRQRAYQTKIENGNQPSTKGLKFSESTKMKMSMSAVGDKNSQFGTCWVMNAMHSIKIQKRSA